MRDFVKFCNQDSPNALPLTIIGPKKIMAPLKPCVLPKELSYSGKNLKFLIVDDEAFNLFAMDALLKNL